MSNGLEDSLRTAEREIERLSKGRDHVLGVLADAVDRAEKAESRVKELETELRNRPERTTWQQEAIERGYALQLAYADSANTQLHAELQKAKAERLPRGLYPLTQWTVEEATKLADAAGTSEGSLFVEWINERKRADGAEAENKRLKHERGLLAIAVVQIAEVLGWKIETEMTGPELLMLAEDIKSQIKVEEKLTEWLDEL
jgi:hypothetical protein